MNKKFAVVLIALLVLVATLFTACGSKDTGDWDYIEEKGELIVGLDDTFAPMGFRQGDEIVGFDIDLANAMSEILGVKVTFQSIDWSAKEAELKAKNIDCIWNGMSATEDRQKSMTLSNKYLKNRILVMSSDKSVNVKSADELKDFKIGTQSDSAALEAMQKSDIWDDIEENVSEYDTYDEAILDLTAGRIDVVVIDEVYVIYNNANKTALYENDYNFGADYYAVGFRKGATETAEKFNDALQQLIDNGTAAKISQKWFGKDLVINEGYDD